MREQLAGQSFYKIRLLWWYRTMMLSFNCFQVIKLFSILLLSARPGVLIGSRWRENVPLEVTRQSRPQAGLWRRVIIPTFAFWMLVALHINLVGWTVHRIGFDYSVDWLQARGAIQIQERRFSGRNGFGLLASGQQSSVVHRRWNGLLIADVTVTTSLQIHRGNTLHLRL